MQVRQAALAAQADAGVLEALGRVDPDDQPRLFGQRERHAAAAAAGVEDPAVASATPARSRNAMTLALR